MTLIELKKEIDSFVKSNPHNHDMPVFINIKKQYKLLEFISYSYTKESEELCVVLESIE